MAVRLELGLGSAAQSRPAGAQGPVRIGPCSAGPDVAEAEQAVLVAVDIDCADLVDFETGSFFTSN